MRENWRGHSCLKKDTATGAHLHGLLETRPGLSLIPALEEVANKNEEGVGNRRKVRAGPGRPRLSLACGGRADLKVALACLAQVRLVPHPSYGSLRHSNGCTAPQNRRF